MLNILIPTLGRSTLDRTLTSLHGQLEVTDQALVVADGVTVDPALIRRHRAALPLQVVNHPHRLGHWGHAIRNAYQPLLTGHTLHMDDDDVYLPGAIATVKRRIVECPDRLLMFRVRLRDGREIPETETFTLGHVSTLCGCVPCDPERLGVWTLRNGGDCDFYSETAERMGVAWFPDVIAEVKGI